LEYVPARPGVPADFDVCLDVLRKLHQLKIVLNDINKHNFLVVDGGKALICDFADCLVDADDETLKVEEDGLVDNLADDFGDSDDDWSDFGQQRLKEMLDSEYRI
jgi:RIO-like serine/threonine protein kinase